MRRPTDNYILTRADAERISDVVRNAEQRIGHIKARHRRRVVASGGRSGGGTLIRNAFCKNDAGGGKYIQVYLDTNLTGEQVNVECTLIGATDLSQCFPTLTEGVRIPVWFDSTHWRCLWWFQGYDVCAEPGE